MVRNLTFIININKINHFAFEIVSCIGFLKGQFELAENEMTLLRLRIVQVKHLILGAMNLNTGLHDMTFLSTQALGKLEIL